MNTSQIKSTLSYLYILLMVCFGSNIHGQGVGVTLGTDTYHILDRLDIKTNVQHDYFSSLKYYNRNDVINFALDLDSSSVDLTDLDNEDLQYLYRDNNEWLHPSSHPSTISGDKEPLYTKIYTDSSKTFYTLEENQNVASQRSSKYVTSDKPIFNTFYKTPANLFEINTKGFYLKLNPLLNIKYYAGAGDEEENLLLNQRGLELRGGIDDRVYFYTNILESQSKFPTYVQQEIQNVLSVPGAGLYKSYNSDVFNVDRGYDYLNGQGYVGFNVTRHIGLQMGHGKHFIGNGFRSLLLSDFSNNYYYLKLNTRIWKFHYQNLFMELAPNSAQSDVGDLLLDKKYMAAHYLGVKIGSKLDLGVFETVVFGRENNFEFQYLNPVILYRTIEQLLGSPDNVLVGLDAKWNALPGYSLYGQLMLDEFKFRELFIDRNGWWANKYGIQVGLKAIDFLGIDHLDLQVEYNSVRPYTYSHTDSTASYSHYNQELAHPIGANFTEYLLRLRYQPTHKLCFKGKFIMADVGNDASNAYWGNNVLIPNPTRVMDYENETGQGLSASILIAGMTASYQIWHNCYIELEAFYRDFDSEIDNNDLNTIYFGGGIRYNMVGQSFDF